MRGTRARALRALDDLLYIHDRLFTGASIEETGVRRIERIMDRVREGLPFFNPSEQGIALLYWRSTQAFLFRCAGDPGMAFHAYMKTRDPRTGYPSIGAVNAALDAQAVPNLYLLGNFARMIPESPKPGSRYRSRNSANVWRVQQWIYEARLDHDHIPRLLSPHADSLVSGFNHDWMWAERVCQLAQVQIAYPMQSGYDWVALALSTDVRKLAAGSAAVAQNLKRVLDAIDNTTGTSLFPLGTLLDLPSADSAESAVASQILRRLS